MSDSSRCFPRPGSIDRLTNPGCSGQAPLLRPHLDRNALAEEPVDKSLLENPEPHQQAVTVASILNQPCAHSAS